MGFAFHSHAEYPWMAALWAVLETVLLWIAASMIFARKDIAVSVE
jgi:hypothetical protein